MHRILDLEEMLYAEQAQAREQYNQDLSRLQASKEVLVTRSRMLQVIQRKACCMESEAQKHGRLLTYSTVCCQRRNRERRRADRQPSMLVKETSTRGG